MKPISPLSLLYFLQLASTAPVPHTTDCHTRSCVISLLGSPHQPPPTHFTEPHFPEHQQDFSSQSSITTKTTSSSSEETSDTLTSTQPLSSSFLLSLTNPATNPTIQKAPFHTSPSTTPQNLPSKPSSALPDLRAADLRKYWETLQPSPSSPKKAQMHSCDMGGEILGSERFYYMRRTRLGTRRDYADLMVVGIVVLFLAVVVALEAVERVGDLGGILCGRRQRRGEIYLEDDDNLCIVKRPFELSPAPESRDHSKDGYRDEKETFTYDSDANERV